mmetsp:Transcript_49732/g.108608  ORF Transcript_49732/g.108608 Transcript_49732/m.108608 type:complete len:247 (-) Transcript_49732:213-953(-)
MACCLLLLTRWRTTPSRLLWLRSLSGGVTGVRCIAFLGSVPLCSCLCAVGRITARLGAFLTALITVMVFHCNRLSSTSCILLRQLGFPFLLPFPFFAQLPLLLVLLALLRRVLRVCGSVLKHPGFKLCLGECMLHHTQRVCQERVLSRHYVAIRHCHQDLPRSDPTEHAHKLVHALLPDHLHHLSPQRSHGRRIPDRPWNGPQNTEDEFSKHHHQGQGHNHKQRCKPNRNTHHLPFDQLLGRRSQH